MTAALRVALVLSLSAPLAIAEEAAKPPELPITAAQPAVGAAAGDAVAGDAVAGDAVAGDAVEPVAEQPVDVLKEIEAIKAENAQLRERLDKLDGGPESKPVRMPLGRDLTLRVFGDVRLRNEQLFNAFDFDNDVHDNWNVTRLRTRIGFDIDYKKLVGAYMQLTNEFRWGTNTKQNADPASLAVAVDQAYIRLTHPWGAGFELTGGRQDLLANPEMGWRGWYGEGWLLFDGTPQDGSTTISFDSAKLRFDGLADTTIDLIYAKLSDRDLQAGTTLGQLYADDDFDEDFVALYGITKLPDPVRSKLDLYTMWRHKNSSANYRRPAGTPPQTDGPNPFWDPALDTVVLGGRLGSLDPILDKHVTFGLEGAYQTGSLDPAGAGFLGPTPYPAGDSVRRDAFGSYAWARLGLDAEAPALNPWLLLRFDYMSGDDPNTKDAFEGWDSLYAEWPKYSELLIYNLYDPFGPAHGTSDPNLGAFTNMYFPSVEIGVLPSVYPLEKRLRVQAGYRYISADEENGPGGGSQMGHLAQFYAEYALVPGVVILHYYFDYFIVGNYYAPTADDAWFSRIEMMFRF